jgi:hypothetical protein
LAAVVMVIAMTKIYRNRGISSPRADVLVAMLPVTSDLVMVLLFKPQPHP